MSLRRKFARPLMIDRLFMRLMVFLPLPMRLLFVKDMRLFRRDPLQWSQFFIFLGLLGLYFYNLPSFTYNMYYAGWVNMVSFLNLSVVGLLLSTFTTRFVFPMISLEGQRYWVLGLLGVSRDSILWGKFLFATIGSLVPCSLLVLLSDLMLKVSQMILVSHQLTCLVLCLGLSGLAVGLGEVSQSSRRITLADRRRIRRHLDARRQHALYLDDGVADGPADPFLSGCRVCRSHPKPGGSPEYAKMADVLAVGGHCRQHPAGHGGHAGSLADRPPAPFGGSNQPDALIEVGQTFLSAEKKQHSWQTGMSAPLDTLLNNFPLW